MFELHESLAFWLAAAINSVGLLALILARLTGRSAAQTWFQAFFFFGFATVGAAMLATVALGSGYWISFGITTSIMVVGAILDLSPGRQLRTV